MSYMPGKIFEKCFNKKIGIIKEGYSPDFFVIDDHEWNLDKDKLASRVQIIFLILKNKGM
ncbi:MAG: hypothetical protein CM15mP91_0660 [Chloroflexota bacterium]|nr:MAG: hypothetical protein CM15mP91_0660 [Chloroflexota bacterium]